MASRTELVYLIENIDLYNTCVGVVYPITCQLSSLPYLFINTRSYKIYHLTTITLNHILTMSSMNHNNTVLQCSHIESCYFSNYSRNKIVFTRLTILLMKNVYIVNMQRRFYSKNFLTICIMYSAFYTDA